MGKTPIKNWSEDDKPREKLLNKGKKYLSDVELLAIIIGSGNKEETAVDLARRILMSVDQRLDKLASLSVADFTNRFKGIGTAKAVSIVAALELGTRKSIANVPDKVKITCSRDIYHHVLAKLIDEPVEHFYVFLTDRSNKIIGERHLSVGGISGTVVDPRLVIKFALDHYASGIILVHNHPSGNKSPSTADINLTSKLREAAKLMDIILLDHLIVAGREYFSFADEGML